MRIYWLIASILAYAFIPTPAIAAGDFSVSSTNNGFSFWDGLLESQVFFRQLTHTQPGNNWTIKIGQGGQLYSLKGNDNLEMIARQRQEHGQWVDEVYQHVISFPPQKDTSYTIVDGDIHQAGYYSKSDLDEPPFEPLLQRSLYSPLFHFTHNSTSKSVSYTTWPQHAHLPRQQKNNQVFFHQTITDLGDGVVGIDLLVSNWSDHAFERINLPWSAFRTELFPTQILSNPNGSYRTIDTTFSDPTIQLADQSTGGWLAVTRANNSNSNGIGLIYGAKPLSADQSRTFIRFATYDSTEIPDVIDGTVATISRQVDLQPGEQLSAHYYLVFGTLAHIKSKGNELQSQVTLTKRYVPESEGKQIAICTSTPVPYRRGCPAGQTPAFSLYDNFVQGSLPLFLMQDTSSGKYIVSSDPYKIDFPEVPYGKTKYIEFLGWAYPSSLANNSTRTYKSLKNILIDRTLFPASGDDATLTVPTSSDTPSKPGDFNKDGKVNLADYNKLISGYGSTYNLSHYNQLLINYGK